MRHAARVHVPFVAGLFAAVMLYGVPADAANGFEPATPRGKVAGCPRGTFPDISRKIGRVECWSCPKGFNRTLPFFAIDGDYACEGPTEFKRARQRAKATGPLPWPKTDCPKDQFLHYDGYCYSCPDGFERTGFPITSITSRQACSKPAYARAARSPDAGCPEGTFLDIGRGDCWSCPAFASYRTVNPVDSPKACTSTVANILAVDSTAMCTQFLTALREGEAGAKRLMTSLAKTVEPLMPPVQELMRNFNLKVETPEELNRLVDRLAQDLRPHGPMIDELQRLSNQMEKNRDRFQALLLNPKVMCEGDLAALDRELIALGLRPDLEFRKSGWLDDLLIGNAHAATKGMYMTVFLSIVVPVPPLTPVPNSYAVTGITNFAGDGDFVASIGWGRSTEWKPARLLEMAKGVSFSGGMHFFPYTDGGDFVGIRALGVELSLGPTGGKREELLMKLGKKWLFRNKFVLSIDPQFWEDGTFPLGFGFSSSPARLKPGQVSSTSPSGTVPIPTPPQKILDLDFSVDVSFSLLPLLPPWK